MTFAAPICFASLLALAAGDVYLNNPRGSNNKLSEQSNNVQNENRLFDSQNNAAGGYQIGDNCKPVCQDENQNYDEDKEGAMQGVMTYYQGSELYIEWFAQHGCGVGNPNVRCQIILQYMTEDDSRGLRDGTKRGNQNTAGGQEEPPTAEAAADITLGLHEPLDYYLACKSRERNNGLYTADQEVLDDRGATATRQNPEGNGDANDRHGLECPEERDYYPYWHPTPWHDIAVITDEPQTRCVYYQAESQNVRPKGSCSKPEFNNPRTCKSGEGDWSEGAAFEEPPPVCVGGIQSRDNHNGNVRNGQPMYYIWRIPEHIRGRCVVRIRYNITTSDFMPRSTINSDGPASTQLDVGQDPFLVDAAFNDRSPGQRRRSRFVGGIPILAQDPKADFLNLGGGGGGGNTRDLQLQVNTNQVGRTFEDRTHTFVVRERPQGTELATRIVNYNVRGRRGNIVQVYPSVEYDFVPPELVVESGTLLHLQWVGSDANAKDNAGNGRTGTDRSNFVQVATRGENVPLPIERHTLLFDAQAAGETAAAERYLVDRLAYLDQDANVACDEEENDEQAVENCKQLNGASAYFDGGLVEMKTLGTHHVVSTRNNDFSNRSQKATITVVRRRWAWYSIVALAAGLALLLALAVYAAAAAYAYARPDSVLFGKRYRPRMLRWLCPKAALDAKVETRRAVKRDDRQRLLRARAAARDGEAGAEIVGKSIETAEDSTGYENVELAKPITLSPLERGLQGCRMFGLQEQRLALLFYTLLNALVALVGFLSSIGGGFRGSLWYPVAKAGGYSLDLNLAVIILPTLKSLQTALRSAGATREWIPIDDPIAFHIAVAIFTVVGAAVHIFGHVMHMRLIASAPLIQGDPLQLWELGEDDRLSGASLLSRPSSITGLLITALMFVLFVTALPCARRGTNACTRRLGGYNLFWRVHGRWIWVYVLLLMHAPVRVWVWWLFPAILVAVDQILLAQRQRPYANLRHAKLLPRDVISLTFDLPSGFAYEAGQYVLLGWRGEWHPFTLTSAPEERCLSLHIRAPDSLDWCCALRRRLLVDAPAAAEAAAGGAAAADERGGGSEAARPRAFVEYEHHTCPKSHVSYCRPARSGGGSHEASKRTEFQAAETLTAAADPTSVAVEIELTRDQSCESLVPPRDALLPDDAVVLQLCGPFGAPAQKVWHFQTIMVVGAGIGVTPFASILRSVQLRARQRQAILGCASSAQQRNRRSDARLLASTGASDCIGHLLRDVVTVPRHIHFYWIVRSQEEFDWFYELLAAAVEGPAQELVHICVFLTGEVELARVRKLPCVHGQYFGRPNWGRIFRQNRERHAGEHIGVFLCGSPVIGKELGRQSAKHTDPPGQLGGTRFSFFKEHF